MSLLFWWHFFPVSVALFLFLLVVACVSVDLSSVCGGLSALWCLGLAFHGPVVFFLLGYVFCCYWVFSFVISKGELFTKVYIFFFLLIFCFLSIFLFLSWQDHGSGVGWDSGNSPFHAAFPGNAKDIKLGVSWLTGGTWCSVLCDNPPKHITVVRCELSESHYLLYQSSWFNCSSFAASDLVRWLIAWALEAARPSSGTGP